MFTITSAVPSDIPVLASSEQQRFAVDNQDVLPQGPVQPAHGPVGPHSGQPPPLWQRQLPQQEVQQQPKQGMLQHVLTAPGLEPVTLQPVLFDQHQPLQVNNAVS